MKKKFNWDLYKLFCYRKGLIEGKLRSFIEFKEWLEKME